MKTNRRRFLQSAAAMLALLHRWPLRAAAGPAPFKLDPSRNIIPAPDDPAQWPAFRAALAAWRAETKARLGYSDALYRRKEFAWSAANYCVLLSHDVRRNLLRPAHRTLHGGRFPRPRANANSAATTASCFGMPIRALAWMSATSSISTATCPADCSGLRDAVRQFHRRGVKVYIDYNPWDTGTRRESEFGPRYARRAGARAGGGRHLPGHDEPGRRGVPRQARCRAAGGDSRRRRRGAAGEPPRSPRLLGAMVRRQLRPGRAAAQMVRAAAHAAPDPALGPRSYRRAARRLDERQRHDGLGKRIRLLGAVESARPVDPARHAARSNGDSPDCSTAKDGRRWCRPNNPASSPRSGRATTCGSGRSSTETSTASRGRC